MDSSIQKLISERFKTLPVILQESLQSIELEQQIEQFRRKYFLSLDQRNKLSNEISLIFLTYESYHNLPLNLEVNLNIPHETASTLAQEIISIIITPEIRATLDAIYKSRDEAEATEKNAAAANKSTSATEQVATPSRSTDTPKAENSPMSTAPAASTAQAPEPVAAPAPAVPQYQKPLTNVPRYGEGDPYRASIDD